MPRLVARSRTAGAPHEPEPDDDEVSQHSDGNSAAGGAASEDDEATMQVDRDESIDSQLVTRFVRYALACEYSRTPIRKEGIKEKVLGPHSRSFRKVFAGAQAQFRMVFGMELVEMPVRERATMTVDEKRRAGKTQSQGPGTSNSYMLVSRLPAAYRTAAILAPAANRSPAEEAQYAALYSTLVSIIMLSGGELSDAKLQRHLARLNARENMPMDKTEAVLQRMVRQGYLISVRSKGVAGEDDAVTWYVGPRGKMELAPEAIAGFVREVYGAPSEELERRLQASLKVRPREAVAEDGSGNGIVHEQTQRDAERQEEEEEEEADGAAARPRRSRRRGAWQSEDEDEG